mgnify:CR=1 FL=1
MIVFTLDDLLNVVAIAVGIVLAIVVGCAGED